MMKSTGTNNEALILFDGNFVNGELYTSLHPLQFQRSSNGVITYQFEFANSENNTEAGASGLMPRVDYQINI